jgi:hypothetical protein
MPDNRILEQRRQIQQIARKLATEQGHYPPNALSLYAPNRHAFDNHGACSGLCGVCGGIAPEHETVKLQDGTIVPITNG